MMAYARARTLDSEAIPVIDITSLRDGGDAAAVAGQLHAASQGLGFIYVKGHGIPADTIAAARATALEFFRAESEQKQEVVISRHHRGWLAQGASKMQDDALADLKESFIWGYQDANGDTPSDHPLRGPNQWPNFLPEMQARANEYFYQAQGVAHHLMRGFALGLGLDEGFFLRTSSKPLSRASYVYYPAQPPELGEQQFGVAAHTDFGVLTVLCQDDTGGLQVQDVSGEWIEAPPIEDTLVVNVGDLLARWTDGAFKSTPHRVVNSSGRERISLVLAFDPDPQTLIDARDVHGAEYQPQHEAITCGDYLIWRFGKAFSYRAEKS